jgi:hypothetical protein
MVTSTSPSKLQEAQPLLAKPVQFGKLKIVADRYDLDTGKSNGFPVDLGERWEFRSEHRETAEDEGRRGWLGQQVSAYGVYPLLLTSPFHST